jgi:hypothetical protein
MSFVAGFSEEECVVENDLTEPGCGIVQRWFEVFVEDLETGEKYPLVDGSVECQAKLSVLMDRANGIASTMDDEKALAAALNRKPIYTNAVVSPKELPANNIAEDDEMVF